MLKQRIITALVLLPVVLGGVFLVPRQSFAVLAALFFLAAAWEWAGMTLRQALLPRLLSVFAVAALMLLVEWRQPAWVLTLLPLCWLVALVLIVAHPGSTGRWCRQPWLTPVGWLLLVPSWAALVHLQSTGAFGLSGPWALLFILCWVWAADTGAYFVGRALGRHKLAPAVSPGKTLEGAAGGLALAMVVAALVAWQGPVEAADRLPLLLVALCTVLASVAGDLFESLIKRQRGVKDSGTMLPGHGGMLDRIDSLTAALPVAVMLISWLSLPGGLS